MRPARPGDEDAVRALINEILYEHGLEPDPGGIDADLAALPSAYLDRGGIFEVLESDGCVVGSVGLMPLGAGRCELRKMYLHPDFRGRGLGRRLLDHALSRARELGFRTVALETAAPLKAAIALYEAYGFRRVAAHRLAIRCDKAYELEL